MMVWIEAGSHWDPECECKCIMSCNSPVIKSDIPRSKQPSMPMKIDMKKERCEAYLQKELFAPVSGELGFEIEEV